jgi:hypothetical protein
MLLRRHKVPMPTKESTKALSTLEYHSTPRLHSTAPRGVRLPTTSGGVAAVQIRAARQPRQSTLALTAADRQYAVVARLTRLSVAPDEARHGLLTNDPHRGYVSARTAVMTPGIQPNSYRPRVRRPRRRGRRRRPRHQAGAVRIVGPTFSPPGRAGQIGGRGSGSPVAWACG